MQSKPATVLRRRHHAGHAAQRPLTRHDCMRVRTRARGVRDRWQTSCCTRCKHAIDSPGASVCPRRLGGPCVGSPTVTKVELRKAKTKEQKADRKEASTPCFPAPQQVNTFLLSSGYVSACSHCGTDLEEQQRIGAIREIRGQGTWLSSHRRQCRLPYSHDMMRGGTTGTEVLRRTSGQIY